MKKFNLISWFIIVVGILFKFFHYPGAAVLIVTGNLLLLTHSIIYIFLNIKSKEKDSFLHLIFAIWSIYFLFRFQYWYGGEAIIFNMRAIFLIPLLLTFIYFIYRSINQVKFKLGHLILTLFFIFNIFIAFTPSHKIFYIVNLNKLLNSEYREFEYYGWDKYSWFLYIAGEKDKALDANKKAQDACELLLKDAFPNKQTELYYDKIKLHETQIIAETWTDYP